MSHLVTELYRHGIIKHGNFKLKSGMTSPFYVDCKSIVQIPSLANRIVDELSKRIDAQGLNWVCGVPDGAVPFAAILSSKTNVPLLSVRKTMKQYGMADQVPSSAKSGDKVILIEDVVTTGGSIESFCSLLENYGLEVVMKICIVNRNPDSKIPAIVPLEFVNGTPCPSNPLLKRLNRRIIWAADCASMDEMLEKLDTYGPHIGILKTHMDTFADFNEDKLVRFIALKKKYDLLVWEDRKFADIGMVMDRQINNSVLKYDKWVDVFSLHAITGRESLETVFNRNPDFKWIIVGQLSSQDNLIDENYTRSAKVIYQSYENVIGMVCQEYLGPEVIHIVPGISNTRKEDKMGQSYSQQEDKQFADFLVCGRSIDSCLFMD